MPAETGRRLATTARAASLLLLIALWAAAAWLAQDPGRFPGPLPVARFAWNEALGGALLPAIGITLARVAAAFLISMLIGVAIGMLAGRSRAADAFIDPWLVIALNLPVLVVVILVYIWVGLNDAAAILAVALAKIPTVVVTVREGARALDAGYDEVGRVFAVPRLRAWRHILLPQMAPYFAAAARGGLSVTWKIVLIVELLGRPNGVGFELNLLFQSFDVTGIIAYGLVFALIMLGFETLLLQPPRAARKRVAMSGLHVAIEAKTYAARPVLGPVGFTAAPGEVLALLAPSGTGKTTALRIILGLDTDFSGSVQRPGGRIGAVFQDPRLLPWMDVAANLRLAEPGLGNADLHGLLESVGLPGVASLYPRQLSLGMARRVALARALAVRPALLVLDEPFASLDPALAAGISGVVTAAAKDLGATILLATHDLDQALAIADRILVLAGRSPASLGADLHAAATSAAALRRDFPFLIGNPGLMSNQGLADG